MESHLGQTIYSTNSGPCNAKAFCSVDFVTGIALDKVLSGVQSKAVPTAKQNHFRNFNSVQIAEVEILKAACHK